MCFSFTLDIAFIHKHFSFMHDCSTRVTFSFPQDLTSKSDLKHDTVWLDVNCFSVILSKVWAYPIHFTTNNNNLINSYCNQKFFSSSSFSHLSYPCPPHFVQFLKMTSICTALITSSAKFEVSEAHIWMVHRWRAHFLLTPLH